MIHMIQELFGQTLRTRPQGRTVSIVDEWCCGYVKGIALDPPGWQPLIEAHPDWFEAIYLYGTEKRLGQVEEISRGLPGCRCETSGVR